MRASVIIHQNQDVQVEKEKWIKGSDRMMRESQQKRKEVQRKSLDGGSASRRRRTKYQ